MADHNAYHALGQGVVPGEDPSNPNRMAYNVPPPQQAAGIPPGGAASPGGGFYRSFVPNQPVPEYGNPQQQNLAPSPQFAFNTGSPGTMGAPVDPSMAGLASQMGGLGIVGDGGARAHKKKHRHAFHDIGGADVAPSQPQNGAPQGLAPQYLNTGLNQGTRPVTPVTGTQQPINPVPGMGPQPGVPGSGMVPTQGKVDPEQIPSIPRSRDIPAQYYFNHVFPTMERHISPPAAIPFVAHDQGNSSPKYARLTLNNIPSTSDFLSSTALPLGMIIQPLARLDPGEQSIPVLDFGDSGPPRCRRCRAYINPFMSFRSGGNKFVCNMCTFPNDVPPEYFAPLEPTGARVDRLQRPELMMGTVEFLVPKEYWNKEPVGLQWLFLIDVSQESVNRGFLKGVCAGIMNALYGDGDESSEEPEGETAWRKIPEGAKIGIVTFDREVQFYNLSVCPHSPTTKFKPAYSSRHNSTKPR